MNPNVPTTADDVVYPDSDGQPMADNTLQWDWMVKIVGELRELFAGRHVFVAGDLLWYPVKGDPTTRAAPDAMVVFGRPPGYRGSYKQWEEDGLAPQVVFEVLSPSNTAREMARKRRYYQRFGVSEYYLIDPYQSSVRGYLWSGERLAAVRTMNGFTSPLLGVRFQRENGLLTLHGPDGRAFLTREERVEEVQTELHRTAAAFEDERIRAIAAEREASQERERAEQERERAEQERGAKERLIAKLRELGVNPDDVLKPTG